MKYLSAILLLIASLALIPSQAQTPYDTFAPETSRPMLGLDAAAQASIERPTAIELVSDSAAYAIVIDQEQQSVYLLNLAERTLLAAAPLTDDVLKWLSVDPLSDKYPNISPYAYCNWNPIKFVDPDGCFSMQNIEDGTNYKTIVVLPTEKVINKIPQKYRAAFRETARQAQSEKMPTLYVDNAQDFAQAMSEMEKMGASTDSYVLSTSHGGYYNGNSWIYIGSDIFHTEDGDFSPLKVGLENKLLFITACELTSHKSGVELIKRFASETGSTIIGSDYDVPAHLGGFRGKDLNYSPTLNTIFGWFGGNYHNSFQMTNGKTVNKIFNLTIDINAGLRWNSGNRSVLSRWF